MVGSAAAVLQTFQRDEWNADVYGVSNIAVHIKNTSNPVQLGDWLYKLNSQLQAFFEKVYGLAEGRVPVEASDEPITEERARGMVGDMMRIYRSLEGVYVSLRRAGLANNSFTAGQVLRLKEHCEAMLDLADWFDTGLNTQEVNAIFARASKEREHGDIYDLEQVR